MALWVKVIPAPVTRRDKIFKFANNWLKEEECRTVVGNSWRASHHLSVSERILFCGSELLRWDSRRKKGFRQQIQACKRRLAWLRGRDDWRSTGDFLRIWSTLYSLMEKENLFWKQRAKEFWLKEGDINSRFFHNAVKSRRRKNKLSGLKRIDGTWCTDRGQVGAMVRDYFEQLFTRRGNTGVADCFGNFGQITAEQNRLLLRDICPEEVRSAIFDMHPEKAPRSDGMNPAFFQKYWDIVGPDISRLCSNIFDSGIIPRELNVTNLVLIPKKDKPEDMGDWRPIALCNVVYKIFSKVLANRLKFLLGSLIGENQSAFVPGRSIVDNVVVSFETHHVLKRKCKGKEGFVALKLDMSKAYDRVCWDFLREIMIRMGFAVRWVNMVMECVSTVSYYVQFERDFLGPITPGRGLRQGDPLSPYLFIMVAEGLSALLKKAEARGDIHGVAVCRGAPRVSHLLFADDSFLFFRATSEEAGIIKDILSVYEENSGQIVNYGKSSLSFSQNVGEQFKGAYCSIFGIPMVGGQSRYLGLPTLVGKNKYAILGYLKDKIFNRIKNWNNRFLSRAGRAVLLKNVIQAMPNYAMNVFFAAE
ncbi:unnamed protein product [Cuscuta epithymum]|uniref:Reverse transcriptase domain-containing protein n=1 Tax=Cuscuta epithymum TaxID=186058 RepID=A0AAV0E8W4_9ASTE|nr:unnamed protein product [Cuscuta epithymum]